MAGNSQKRRAPNMTDVAKHAGVSQRTVSNVVSGYLHVSERTRKKVQASIEALGFQPNVAAQRLREGRSRIIALAVPKVSWAYFAEIAHLVQKYTHSAGYTLVIVETAGSLAQEKEVLQGFRTNLIDGLILSSIELGPSELNEMQLGIPVVLIGERIEGTGMLHLSIDNVQAAGDMAQHLYEQGARSFWILGDTKSIFTSSAGSLRRRGFVDQLNALGLGDEAWRSVSALWTHDDAYRAMTEELAQGHRQEAVFAMNDLLAFGAMRALKDFGITTPTDVLVSGWDDVEFATYSVPSVTSISPNKEEIARLAVTGLIDLVEGRAVSDTEVETEYRIITRESTSSGPTVGSHSS